MPGGLRTGQGQAERLSDPLCLELVRATLGTLSLRRPIPPVPEVEGLHLRKRRGRRSMEDKQGWQGRSRQRSIMQEPRLWSVEGPRLLWVPPLPHSTVLGCFPGTGGGRAIKLATCFHFSFVLHLSRNVFGIRAGPLHTNQTGI